MLGLGYLTSVSPHTVTTCTHNPFFQDKPEVVFMDINRYHSMVITKPASEDRIQDVYMFGYGAYGNLGFGRNFDYAAYGVVEAYVSIPIRLGFFDDKIVTAATTGIHVSFAATGT